MKIESRSDIEFARKAFARDWSIPAETRAEILDQLFTIVRTHQSHRWVLSAARAIEASERSQSA